jgi:hypothetical protein
MYSGLGRLVVEESTSHSDTPTLGRTSLDEGSVGRSDLYLTTHPDIHKRQTSMPPVGFESANSASERPQTDALERAAAGKDIAVR